MVELADGVAAYTCSDADRFRQIFTDKRIAALGNACLGKGEVKVDGRYSECRAILYVGRLVAEKKVDLLIHGFALARKQGAKVSRLDIVGDGPEASVLKNLARSLGVCGVVVFHGHLAQGRELEGLYRDALAATSPGYAGLSVIQAMGHGVPILVSRNEPHSPEIEACIDGKTAVYVEASTPEEWAGQIERVFTEREKWLAARQEIAQFAAENYTFEAMARSFLALADEVMGAARKNPR